jgi:predicted amidohydrolase YtcJ
VLGTDAPVEPPDPWTNLAIAVTRASSRWPDASPFHPEQALGLDRVLRAACSEPALVAGETDRGRLVAGHRADLIVIPAGALDEAPTRGSLLESVRPRATLVDGEVAYRDPGFDP